MPDREELEFYASHGPISHPGNFQGMLNNLPSGVNRLCDMIQGIMIHAHWAERYDRKLSEEEALEPELRHVTKQLQRIKEIHDADLASPRSVENRLACTCRDFALMLTTSLREQDIPARARCGFGAYFEPNKYVDHWVCEYWNSDQQRWILVDAQLDEFQQKELRLPFDPLDVPRDMFLVAGQAWQLCRNDQADPEKFGIFDMWGLWFIKSNLIRDLASLNKTELLPWDSWGLMSESEPDESNRETLLLDRVAELTSVDHWSFEKIQYTYQQEEGLKVPARITSYSKKGPEFIDL
jgi:hypothetical protein